ncbi:MAG: hypothetical protein JWO23_72 [Solirubrobacterales bacterium]|jgi:hypothetical protein|nr:hypothetical protein [Solirubrobacterales bacterium]MCW3024732.1 hypothetical protein [Solirubrobacterales bacterium]
MATQRDASFSPNPVIFGEEARSLEYIREFDSVLSASQEAAATVTARTEKYPDLGNPSTLWLAP